MLRIAVVLVLTSGGLMAEVRTFTLRQAVQLALEQNRDLTLARLDEHKAEQAVRLAKDPFTPKVVAGSGLAYSSGFPMSIEGATPSILQARAVADVFNRPQSCRVAAAQENRRAATLDAAVKQEEVALRTAELFLEAEKAAKLDQLVRRQAGALQRVLAAINARVAEGRELPIESRPAALNLARAEYHLPVLESNRAYAERVLAGMLGLDPNDRVQAAPEERTPPALPPAEDAAVQKALESSKELRSLEARLLAKGFGIRAERAERLPKLHLVAQYALLGRFNNYEDFFRKFQRHNGQLGVSIQIPLSSGLRVGVAVAQAHAEAAQLRVQIRTLRSRLTTETARCSQAVQQAESARDLARMDLEVAREQVSTLLAQTEEGRASLRQLEEARSAETDKWLAFYDSAARSTKPASAC